VGFAEVIGSHVISDHFVLGSQQAASAVGFCCVSDSCAAVCHTGGLMFPGCGQGACIISQRRRRCVTVVVLCAVWLQQEFDAGNKAKLQE
jgi:hypothetical protein